MRIGYLLLPSLVIIALLRISATYSVFWQTWDEPAHIAAGMEWLDKGRYTYEPFHPPLARAVSALIPYLDGVRSTGIESGAWGFWDEGNAILHTNDAYEHNLTLARSGMLAFFIIACAVVAAWARSYGGIAAALSALLLFTTLPPVLAHAGLATLDMACAALVAAAVFALDRWLDRPTVVRSVLLGLAGGAAILTKFSAIGFFGASGILTGAVYGVAWLLRRPAPDNARPRLWHWVGGAVLVAAAGLLTIWAGYRFSYSSIQEAVNLPSEDIEAMVIAAGPFHDSAYAFVEATPVPAPELYYGLYRFFDRNSQGHLAYFLGNVQSEGSWYFFPVTFAIKTPLPFLALLLLGGFAIVRRVLSGDAPPRWLVPIAAAFGVFAITIAGNVNNGVRQALPVYPFLAIVAGYGAVWLWQQPRLRRAGAGLAVVLLAWQVTGSFVAHPDYLAYFNPLAGGRPETIVGDSDLDWGQDLKRLSIALKRHNVTNVAIAYNGSLGLDLDRFDFPPRHELVPYEKTTGWIAISVKFLQVGWSAPPYDHFAWLKAYEPVERVGRSIWLYDIPEEER